MQTLGGIDGCRAGWFAILQDQQTGHLWSRVSKDITDFLAAEQPDVIAIDIPIGLTNSGPRACDVECRKLLKGRASSVFPAPIRPALQALDRANADAISRGIHGKGVPAQAFGIYSRVREVDDLLQAHSDLKSKVFEIHPELSFWAWNGNQIASHPKKSAPGFMQRLSLVQSEFGENAFDQLRSQYPRNKVSDDDILDAYAALWTAKRIADGTSQTCPAAKHTDPVGLPMNMYY